MLEDELLKWRFKQGNSEALGRIYEKYVDFLLTLSMALLNDKASAQDAVHDTFVKFASSNGFKLKGSLKSYLATCVLNSSRDMLRASSRKNLDLSEAVAVASNNSSPVDTIIGNEQSEILASALSQLPPEQREAIVMHIKGRMKFRQIAGLQDASINTVQSRYRYGLDKLRSILNKGYENEIDK